MHHCVPLGRSSRRLGEGSSDPEFEPDGQILQAICCLKAHDSPGSALIRPIQLESVRNIVSFADDSQTFARYTNRLIVLHHDQIVLMFPGGARLYTTVQPDIDKVVSDDSQIARDDRQLTGFGRLRFGCDRCHARSLAGKVFEGGDVFRFHE